MKQQKLYDANYDKSLLRDRQIAKDLCYDFKLMLKTVKQIKLNLHFMKINHGKVLPGKMNTFLYIPSWMLAVAMSFVFRSSFGYKFMYQHSIKAPDEMRVLHRQLYTYMEKEL